MEIRQRFSIPGRRESASPHRGGAAAHREKGRCPETGKVSLFSAFSVTIPYQFSHFSKMLRERGAGPAPYGKNGKWGGTDQRWAKKNVEGGGTSRHRDR